MIFWHGRLVHSGAFHTVRPNRYCTVRGPGGSAIFVSIPLSRPGRSETAAGLHSGGSVRLAVPVDWQKAASATAASPLSALPSALFLSASLLCSLLSALSPRPSRPSRPSPPWSSLLSPLASRLSSLCSLLSALCSLLSALCSPLSSLLVSPLSPLLSLCSAFQQKWEAGVR